MANGTLGLSRLPVKQLRAGGAVVESSRWIDQPIYDTETLTVAAATPQQHFFFTTIGAKSRVDTNMPTDGTLTYPRTFAVQGIEVAALPTVAGVWPTTPDLQNIRAFGRMELYKGNTRIYMLPVERLHGPGLEGSLLAGAATGFINLGSSAPRDFHRLGFKIALPSDEPFRVEFHLSQLCTIAVAIRIRIWLLGKYTLSVQ